MNIVRAIKIRTFPYYLRSSDVAHLTNKELNALAEFRRKKGLLLILIKPIYVEFNWHSFKSIRIGMHKLHTKPYFGKISFKGKVLWRSVWWMNIHITYNLPWEGS